MLIEGNITDLDSREKTDPDSKLIVDKVRVAYDTLMKIALDFRIPILYTPSIYYTAELLVHLASNRFKDKDDGPLLKKIKKSNPFYIQQLVCSHLITRDRDKIGHKAIGQVSFT